MKTRILLAIAGLVAVIVLIVVMALLVIGLPSLVVVPTGAMARTILPGDRIVVSSGVDSLERGDIIVFRYPLDPRERYVKRVVALEGETVQLVGTEVLINGRPMTERRVFARSGHDGLPGADVRVEGTGEYTVYYEDGAEREGTLFGPEYGAEAVYTVPAGYCFVLGDNRDNSMDSRYWGPVPVQNIVGEALFIYASQVPDDTRLFKRLR